MGCGILRMPRGDCRHVPPRRYRSARSIPRPDIGRQAAMSALGQKPTLFAPPPMSA